MPTINMHTATVTVLSVRKDGKGFKADPGDGERWFSLPDNMAGMAEWKKTYDIGWTESPGKLGTFFNVKQISAPKTNGSPVVKAGNGNGEIDIRSIFGLLHSYNGRSPTVREMVQDLRNAEEALRIFNSGGSTAETEGPAQGLDETF